MGLNRQADTLSDNAPLIGFAPVDGTRKSAIFIKDFLGAYKEILGTFCLGTFCTLCCLLQRIFRGLCCYLQRKFEDFVVSYKENLRTLLLATKKN